MNEYLHSGPHHKDEGLNGPIHTAYPKTQSATLIRVRIRAFEILGQITWSFFDIIDVLYWIFIYWILSNEPHKWRIRNGFFLMWKCPTFRIHVSFVSAFCTPIYIMYTWFCTPPDPRFIFGVARLLPAFRFRNIHPNVFAMCVSLYIMQYTGGQ